jgi:hypothetical protein
MRTKKESHKDLFNSIMNKSYLTDNDESIFNALFKKYYPDVNPRSLDFVEKFTILKATLNK